MYWYSGRIVSMASWEGRLSPSFTGWNKHRTD
jgi:hypothetical protein